MMAKLPTGAFYNFSSKTSMHGFIHIQSETSSKVRCIWMCVIAIACSGTGIHLYSLLDTYFQYDSYNTITVERGELEYPDITICNTEAFSMYNMHKNTETSGQMMKQFLTGVIQIVTSGLSQEEISFSVNHLSTTEGSFSSLNFNGILKLSTSLTELIVDCKFGNKNCSGIVEFIPFFHHVFGICYTLRINTTIIGPVSKGPEDGLSLILKSNHMANFAYNMVSKVANVDSLKVTIHQKETLPPVLSNGIDILPGTSTNIGLTMKKIERLDSPYGKCQPSKTYPGHTKFIYSEELCEQLVKFKEISQSCGCKSMQFNDLTNSGDEYKKNCLYPNENNLNLIKNIPCEKSMNDSSWADSLSECVWPCSQLDYESIISQAYWPQNTMVEDFIFKYIHPLSCESPVRFYYEHVPKQVTYNSTFTNNGVQSCEYTEPEGRKFSRDSFRVALENLMRGKPVDLEQFDNATFDFETTNLGETEEEWIRKYFYRLNIYFSKPTISRHRQVISFSVTDLLSSVGGVLGLWIGCSFITIIEIFWLFANLVATFTDNQIQTANTSPVQVLTMKNEH